MEEAGAGVGVATGEGFRRTEVRDIEHQKAAQGPAPRFIEKRPGIDELVGVRLQIGQMVRSVLQSQLKLVRPVVAGQSKQHVRESLCNNRPSVTPICAAGQAAKGLHPKTYAGDA